jgi:serine/threonine-protein kinase
MHELGSGGMASVYLARDRRHGREVAIKVLSPDRGSGVSAERFLREIRLVERALHVDECLRLARQVADALDYAHARGVIHRDVKPENVLLDGVHALLADFGVARGPGPDHGDAAWHSLELTSAGMALGTPAYMSPEQAAGDRDLDARSDVYGLGCVCYEMLAGRPPFTGPNAFAIISQHLTAVPPRLVAARGPLPEGITSAVARALAKAPAERFASAGALVAEMEREAAEARAPSPADARLRAAERQRAAWPHVLVLEFTNLARAPEADWISTGIAETVAADLGKVAGVRVIGQDAATRRRIAAVREERTIDAALAAEIGRAVGAEWVVWGAFQKFGPRIRITPHYVDTADSTHLGGEKIDGLMDDIFALQDRIVTELAAALRIEITSGELQRIAHPETAHLGAYEHYARGYRAYLQFGRESVHVATEHFRAAIALDPDYALAHAGLGIIQGPRYIASGSQAVLDEGVRLLERAIALDPTIGEAHAWLAYMQFRQARFDDAERTARRGLECESTSDMGWYMLGSARLCRAVVAHEPGELRRAVPPYLRAVSLNPSNLPAWMALGAIYALRGQYAHAAVLLDRAVQLEGSGANLAFLGARVQRAAVHMGAGELDAAAPLLSDALARYAHTDHVYAETMTAYAHVLRGCLAERTGRLQAAADDFTRACSIADAHEHRITIGAFWVRGRFGLARVLHRQGARDEAGRALTEGAELLTSRRRFVWTWIHGATDAEALYDLACTLATLGRAQEAERALQDAMEAGWGDVGWLRHDPAFFALRDTPEILRLGMDATAAVDLPAPTGSGGLW